MARHGLGNSCLRIPVPIMIATVTDEFTAKPAKAPKQVYALHYTSISSTLRISGISPLVTSL
jgi:hypothetical protein